MAVGIVHHAYRGIVLKLTATFFFSLMYAVIKLSGDVPIGEVIFFRCFFALIPLLTVKDSAYVQWHAKQGLAVVAASFAVGIAGMILSFVPIIHFVIACALGLVQLGLWVLDILAMVKAFNGERWEIPVVSQIAKKF